MSTRARRSDTVNNSRAAAFAELARFKREGGKRRAKDYEIEELENVYDEVDETTYAAIFAEKRREAREFVEHDEDDSEYEDYMEDEFEYEDEESRIRSEEEIRKRKRDERRRERALDRLNGKGGTDAGPISLAPTRRVNAAFFGNGKDDLNVNAGDVPMGPSVLDSLLHDELDHEAKAEKLRRRSKIAHKEFEKYGELRDNEEYDLKKGTVTVVPEQFRKSIYEPTASYLGMGLPVYTAPPPTYTAMLNNALQQHKASEHQVKSNRETSMAPPASASLPWSEPGNVMIEDGDHGLDGIDQHVSNQAYVPLKSIPPVPAFHEGSVKPLGSLRIGIAAAAADVSAVPESSKRDERLPIHVHSEPMNVASVKGAAEVLGINTTDKKPVDRDMFANSVNFSSSVFQPVPASHEVQAEFGQLARNRGNGHLLLYWYDAHEEKTMNASHLYMFCKAAVGSAKNPKGYVNVTLKVENVDRVLYFLPKTNEKTGKPYDVIPDVYDEVVGMLERNYRVNQIRAKQVQRIMPFGDSDAPKDITDYLKVKYTYNYPVPPVSCSGKTFSRVFGTKSSATERVLVKRGLMGPGWIRVQDAVLAEKVAYTKFVVRVDLPEKIHLLQEQLDVPTFSALSLSFKTHLNPKTNQHEIAMISGVLLPTISVSTTVEPETIMRAAASPAFMAIRQMDRKPLPIGIQERAKSVHGGLEAVPNEQALLNYVLTKIMKLDPDIIVGHDILGFGLDVLLSRLNACKTRDWSRLGRLLQRKDLHGLIKSRNGISATAGRLVVDTMVSSKELCPREKDYSLPALADSLLKKEIPERTDAMVTATAYESEASLAYLLTECIQDADIAFQIASNLNAIPLSRQLTCLSGNIWSRTLRGARAERIEFLLCHELNKHKPKMILPDKLNKFEKKSMHSQDEGDHHPKDKSGAKGKPGNKGGKLAGGNHHQLPSAQHPPNGIATEIEIAPHEDELGEDDLPVVPGHDENHDQKADPKSTSSRRKPQYSGGMVLEPQRGLYDRFVLQLDFNSLYPSIIQEYNICFTTLDINAMLKLADESEYRLPDASAEEGVLPRVLRRLVEQRKQVKSLMKGESDALRYKQLNTRQLAIKLTGNSLYGCLGFENSRFYAKPLAELITFQGRCNLQRTVDLIQDQFQCQVIYGDTDSLFIHTGLNEFEKVVSLGIELKREINKRYRMLEIEVDAVYARLLLLRKKKYAAMKVQNMTDPSTLVREVKGLDIVRHDWSGLTHAVSDYVLNQLLSINCNMEEAISNVLSHLEQTSELVRNNKLALQLYVITRSLTKNPDEYPDASNLPHVQVALRRKAMGKNVRPGEYIQYVICKPVGTDQAATNSKSLANRAYHPEEIHAAGGALEIDTEYYLVHQILPPVSRLFEPIAEVDASRLAAALGLDPNRFTDRSHINNNQDHEDFIGGNLFDEAVNLENKYASCTPFMTYCANCKNESKFESALNCPKCYKEYSAASLLAQLRLLVRNWTNKYYSSDLLHEKEDGAIIVSRDISLDVHEIRRANDADERWLYKQLRYLSSLMEDGIKKNDTTRGAEDDLVLPSRQASMPVAASAADSVLNIEKRNRHRKVFEELHRYVGRVIEQNGFHFIDLGQVFSLMGLERLSNRRRHK